MASSAPPQMPSGHRPALAVVVPLYNEVEHVAGFLRTIPPWIRHVVVVNDASTDGSDEEVRSLCDPRVRLVHHPCRKGVGYALGTGFREGGSHDSARGGRPPSAERLPGGRRRAAG